MYDGAPSDRLYGADIEPAFWDLGYELFKDRSTFRARFVEASLLEESPSLLETTKGPVDIVYLGSVLHLWDWDAQVVAAKNIISLTKVGSEVFGAQLGCDEGVAIPTGWKNNSGTIFYHDGETFKELWKQAAKETGSEWTMETEIKDLSYILPEERDREWMRKGTRTLLFEGKRIH